MAKNTIENAPIITQCYCQNSFAEETLDYLPSRAKNFYSVLRKLEGQGVQWKSFTRVNANLPETARLYGYYVGTGYQVVGVRGDTIIILATKVGVKKSCSGYLVWVGPKTNIQNAAREAKTASSTSDILGKVLVHLI